MYDIELINRVCNLTCSKADVVRNQTTIKYDANLPFKKYYNAKTIIQALEKYINNEWDDTMLSHWACVYCWILCGGFEDNLKENLNSMEDFFKEVLTWDLDGLAFFDDGVLENGMQDIYEMIEFYKNFDHIWQTINDWKGFCAPVGIYDEVNDQQYGVLINENLKEYMIIHTDCFEIEAKDKYFKKVLKEELINLVNEIKEKNYKILPNAEEWFYSDLLESILTY